MNAAAERVKGQDLFDIGFLVETHGDRLSSEQIERADSFSRDYEGLADRFRQAFYEDNLLKNVGTADDRALAFRIAVIGQLHRRGLAVIEQSVPGTLPLADVLARHKIWLDSRGRDGCRANLAGGNLAGAVLCGQNFEGADLRRADFRGADLRNANLRHAELEGASFDGADLRGTDATGAILTDSSFQRGIVGPTTNGFAEALARIESRRRTYHVSPPEAPRRSEPELDFGLSR